MRSEGYNDFLTAVVGLPWAVRKIAERIHPTPRYWLRDGVLHCETVCTGGKPVFETLVVGASLIAKGALKVEALTSLVLYTGFVSAASSDSPASSTSTPP